MENLLQDLRFGFRSLLKNPGFAIVAIITLGLGIGANTAIFSVVNGVLLRPLPYHEPARLAMVYVTRAQAPTEKAPLCQSDFVDWKSQNQVFENIAAYSTNRFNFSGGESPEQIQGAWVTADFFNTLAVQPVTGRAFLPDEDQPGIPQTVVISDGFWRRHLGANPNIINQQITLNSKAFTVIGIMPAGFSFPEKDVELWAAERLAPTRRGPYYMRGLARLRPDTTLEQAKVEMGVIAGRVQQQINSRDKDLTWTATSLTEATVGDIRTTLVVLAGAVVFVLLIASANVANLLLARATAREKEMSVRLALGASRARLLRQLLTESLLLALCGGTVGVFLAIWGIDLLLAISPSDIPRLQEIRIDGRVLGFTLLISAFSGLIFGLAPALQSSRLNLNESLKESGRSNTESIGRRRMRNTLIIAEIALSLMLLVGAGLMMKSFTKLQNVSPGFQPEQILTMNLTLPRAQYDSSEKVTSFYQQLINRLKTVPGVEAAGLTNSLPPNKLEVSDSFSIEGKPVAPGSSEPIVPIIFISPDYFNVLGVPLLEGRHFSEADQADSPPVVIINKTLADHYFPDENPIGKRFKAGGGEKNSNPWMEIVGVVGNVKYTGLDAKPESAYYLPAAQVGWRAMYLAVRTSSNPIDLARALRQEVWALDKDLPVTNVATMEQLLAESVAQPRFRTLLLGIFALVALVLASVGIYGVISYTVTRRTYEIGIRMALGAQTGEVLKLIIRQGMTLAVIGVSIGIAASLVLTRVMEKLLYEVSVTDEAIFAGVAGLLGLVALLACYIPARRATKVDPMIALRYE
jgi:putative ABC transport system permease protein